MSEEFHYPPGVWKELKGQLPKEWLPLDEYLSQNRPFGIRKNEWVKMLTDDINSPITVYVWHDRNTKKQIATSSLKGKECIAASELFLSAMRPHIQGSIFHHRTGGYVTPGEMKKSLIGYSKKISKLIGSINKLPLALRHEMSAVFYKQKQAQWIIKEAITNLPKKMPKNYIRGIFLQEMFDEYEKFYGTQPNHTYDRQLGPEASGFHGVAYKMCKWARHSPQGIEKVFAKIKLIKSPRELEEVIAEINERLSPVQAYLAAHPPKKTP